MMHQLFLAFLLTAVPFDWGKVCTLPPGADKTAGNQVLHFKSHNRPYWDSPEAHDFVKKYLKDAAPLGSDAEVLRFGSDHVTLEGLYIEAGVCTGKTINFIAALNPYRIIYGFDSFEGLPEDWVRKESKMVKGTFAFKNPNELPPVLHNVRLIKGWFSETMPSFVKNLSPNQPIAFLHVDSDIYSAAVTVLSTFEDHIVPGTVLVFDELYNYPGCENHEWKAFQEFLRRKHFEVEYLAYNLYHEQVAVRILAK